MDDHATAPRRTAPLAPKADKDTVRRHNLSLVLRAVYDESALSRAGAAARTGLTRAAVSSLADQLIRGGFLTESGKSFSGQAGRPGTMLTPARSGPAGVGVEINVDYVAVCVMDLAGTDRVRLTEYLDNRSEPPTAVLGRAARIAARALDSAAEQSLHPVGVELALPGLVSGGAVRQAPNLGWKAVDAEDLFRAALREVRPNSRAPEVTSDNEANLAALAELWFGRPERRVGHFLYLSGEIGVGGAVVVGGELLRGAHGFAGEIGHTPVDPEGPECRCGSRGCLEQYAGQLALLRAAGIDADAGAAGVLELEHRARADDESALGALADAGRSLGIALSGAVNLLDPQAVVLGGIYRTLLPWLAPAVDGELSRRAVSGLWPPESRRVRASSLAGDAARGAAARVVRRIVADPLAYE
ncbi:ROK family transcriptional regulator [Streptomyces sp. NBC_00083]|uniref:ROK family transcriptional regulator n=1 Tax=Streptomyces sp. NBC_00083 TaxID=2975647 RepID=UPI00224F1DA5|nr:ROK family transcriptional regulator [Streptomyces sp. NBC_00083]MCX5386671.1 ROK family protein [Streptomyces sp. NBC_00083]